MASESSIALEIRTALAQYLKRDVESIRPTDRLREDLGLDSLAMIELLFKIEEHFNLEIPNEDLSRIASVTDVTAYVEEKLAGAPVAAGDSPPVVPAPSARPPLAAMTPSAPSTAVARPASPASAPPAKPAKVTSIKAAAKRKAAKAPVKPALNKKGSRRA